MIFKVLAGGEGDNLQKSTASRSKSNNQVDAFRLGATTRCPPRCLPLAQSARIHGQRLKLSKFGSLEPDNSDTFVSSPPPRWRARNGRFGEFRSENRLIGCRWGSGRLTVEVGWPDQERSPEVFRSSLICSQSESYKNVSVVPELTYRPLKKLAYLFGLPLARNVFNGMALPRAECATSC